jgi:hypothetical protein
MIAEDIAKVAHEANRAYCETIGDFTQLPWDDAPQWQRESARMGVDLHLSGDFPPEASHVSWMQNKLDEGWKHGPVKDPEKKEHPCIVPFDQLPREQQAKDYLFQGIVHALRGFLCLLVVACLSGCVATTPAFGGKTKAETSFVDVDGTHYTRNVELPAGVALEGQDAMSLSIGPDGAYQLNIGQSGGADSTAQGAMMTQVGLAQIQAVSSGFSAGLNFLGQAVQAAVPIFLKQLDNELALGTIDAEQHAVMSTAFMDWFTKLPIPQQPTQSAPSTTTFPFMPGN